MNPGLIKPNMLLRLPVKYNEQEKKYYVELPEQLASQHNTKDGDQFEYIWLSDSGNGTGGAFILRKYVQ